MEMKGSYELKRATTKAEFADIMDVIWAANYTPYDPVINLFFPIHGFSPFARQTAISESITRFWTEHEASPSSNWYYVVDAASGKAVGCAQWHVHLKNPFPNGVPVLKAPWWPADSEGRHFCERILNQVYKPRASWMTRPHLALSWMAVHPDHRRRGIGSLLMKAGEVEADALGVESWIEASAMGKPLYEKFGFRPLFRLCYDMEKEGKSDEWRKLEHEMTPPPFWAMWRPKQGRWQEGVGEDGGAMRGVKMPWELGRDDGVTERNGDVV
ncbi:acyl-CoA N-acyltransferase [Lophiotrema nucula]|uniref:Acyl-CoA N-acyltransferase n=1 Tax=Lophiotrema nucula TaxID=690887 RepID=A0A6A5YVM4_9PLEO|nr:acyl-CoA N-acyltransferase [Lophiotrema nucula]